ncbi:Regulatory protein AfsR [Mycobacterium basiliense]|uniref:Regulatory protein AfsR n=1 Tax=Mycobacterium basiliense TaxID=2094119 RepID=A0A3S4FQS5_9MYCO|nr:BTAD domain-containing putative transcriptional regulator [Mycobacterium basiliense]VDM88729.1 Regulatory protein AfsR [Mycobacterium basiliense]
MTVEFRLLGDVEVLVDGQRLDLGHARQRCVLAALLVDVNHPVSVDHLVDRVWSDRPPYSARGSLTSYVSRLRTLLAEVRGVVISRGSGGYVLEADSLSIDLFRFRAMASQARSTPDPIEAAALFDRSLALWGGEPFASLDTPWANEMRRALQSERRSVELDRNDAKLRTGRHSELLAGLTAELAVHPLDERLAGQLMLAQYRSGRQADALATYRHMRQRLVDELGVDPGSTLKQMHQHILAGETDGAMPQPDRTGPGHPATVPAQVAHPGLARRVTSFVGHQQEQASVIGALRESPLVTLTGVGGVGKTRLALEVARDAQAESADRVWICELAPLDHPDAVGHTVAAALGLRQQPGLDIEESVIEYLRARAALVVVDNCEHVVEAAARLVERIVQQCPRVSVLATSRQPLGIEGERIVVTPPLAVTDATQLFADRARAGRPDFKLEDQPDGVVAEICRRVDCLPLGVELAAARMRVMSAPDVVRRLDRLEFLRGGSRGALPRQQSLAATIDWSYRLLSESEQALFSRLSVFAGSFDLDAAHGVCGLDGATEDDTLELLAGLVDKSMVVVRSVSDRTRYGLLETLRACARDRLQECGTAEQYARRHATYYTELVERAGVGVQGPDERDWVKRMLPDYDNLRAAFECAMADEDADLGLRLVASASELCALRIGYEVAGWAERVIDIADADHPLYAAVVGTAARAAWAQGDFGRVRRLAPLAAGRIPGPGTARFAYPADALTDVALFEGDVHGVLAYWRGAADHARRVGDPIRLSQTLSTVAVCQRVLFNSEDALLAGREAVEVAESTANPTTRSGAYFSLGFLLKKSEPARALALFDEAARLAGQAQNFWWYGIALMEAAATRGVHGDPREAARLFVEVLDHWDRVGDWSEMWISLRYVTRLLVRLGADEDALFLHFALLTAGKPSPLRATQLTALEDRLGAGRLDVEWAAGADGPAAVTRARGSLQRYTQPAAAAII